MAAPTIEVIVASNAAAAVSGLAVAVFLAFVPPATLAKRFLALFLACVGFQLLTALSLFDPAHDLSWGGLFLDLGVLAGLAELGVLAVYPTRLRLRGGWSTWLALVAITMGLVYAAFFTIGRGFITPPPGYRSFLGALVVYGGALGTACIFLSMLLRARELPEPERKAARWVAAALVATIFTRPGAFLTFGVGAALGLPAYNPFDEGLVSGGPAVVVEAVHVLGRVVAPALVVAFAWRREHTLAPAGIVAFGAVMGIIGLLSPHDFLSPPFLVTALVPAYVVVRYGAFGTPRVSPRWATFVAVAAAISILTMGITITAAVAADSSIGLAVGVGLSILVAGATAGLVLLPLTRKWAQDLTLTKPAGPAPVGEPLPGDLVLGRYRVVREVGRGGMGAAYLAHDNRIDREVVLKVLRGPDAQEALREARALAQVKHPNVVQVLDVENVLDGAVLILEHVDGGSLAERLERGALEKREFASVARDLFDALEAVHAAGLVHRDLKPGNVLLTARGQAKLADFGIARRVDGQVTVRGLGAGEVAGTLRFVSPEVARGKEATQRSDLFSLGATLFEAWTGEPLLAPKPGESAIELQLRAAAAKPFRRRVSGPAALQAWFARALDPDPAKRFADAASMRAAFDGVLSALRPNIRKP